MKSTQEVGKEDMVNKPSHYQGEVQCIELISAMTSGLQGIVACNVGQWVKYCYRAGKKKTADSNNSGLKTLQDLEKAMWYLSYLKEENEPGEKFNKNIPDSYFTSTKTFSPVELHYCRKLISDGKAEELGQSLANAIQALYCPKDRLAINEAIGWTKNAIDLIAYNCSEAQLLEAKELV